MSSKLDKLKQNVTKQSSKVTVITEIYLLAKELGCLGDLLGREYEFIRKNEKIVGFRQKPITVPAFVEMMNELEKDYRRQEKQTKKGRRGKR